MEQDNQVHFFVGTYTNTIHRLEYDSSSKTISQTEEITGIKNPSFLKHIKEENILISVSEIQDKPSILLIDLDKMSANYNKVIQELPTHGADPCYITYSRYNNLVFCCNYSGSSLSYYKFENKNLTLVETIHYEGDVTGEKGNRIRQEASHPHSLVLDSCEKYAFLQDLGCDLIRIYEVNSEGIQLKRQVPVTLGSGPRHMFNRNDTFYLITELTHTVYVFDFDRNQVQLNLAKSYPLFNEQYKEDISKSYSAEIKVDFDQTIYVSVREADRLFIIPQNGKQIVLPTQDKELEKKFNYPSISTLGNWPRNFNLTDEVIIVANQRSHNIVVFDKKTYNQICQYEVQSPVYIELIN